MKQKSKYFEWFRNVQRIALAREVRSVYDARQWKEAYAKDMSPEMAVDFVLRSDINNRAVINIEARDVRP